MAYRGGIVVWEKHHSFWEVVRHEKVSLRMGEYWKHVDKFSHGVLFQSPMGLLGSSVIGVSYFWCSNGSNYLGKTYFPVFCFSSLCSYLFILALRAFAFPALTLAFQRFSGKHCLQLLGLRRDRITRNRFPVKLLLTDSLFISVVVSLYLNTDLCKLNHRAKRWKQSPVGWFLKSL